MWESDNDGTLHVMYGRQVPGSTTARPAIHPVQMNSTRTTSGKELVAAPILR